MTPAERPVGMIGLPYARMLCGTCGQRFLFAADLVAHIIAVREAEEARHG